MMDVSIPYARAAFSAQDEVGDLEVVLCAPAEADADLVNAEQLKGRLAVARRGGCTFQEKTERVELAGARGLVIVNSDDALFKAWATQGYCAGISVVVIRAKDEAALLASGSSSCLRPYLTAEQDRLWTRLRALEDAHDWPGVVALEHEALALARDVRDAHPRLADEIHGILGPGFHEVGQYARAVELHAEHKAISAELGDREGLAKACGNLGNCYYNMDQYARAVELYAEAKAIFEELGDRARVAAACGNLGDCYSSMEQYARALELHQECKAMAEELGDRERMARACGTSESATIELFSTLGRSSCMRSPR